MTGNAVELGIGDRCEMLITFHGDVKERVAGLGGVLDRRFKDRDQQLVCATNAAAHCRRCRCFCGTRCVC